MTAEPSGVIRGGFAATVFLTRVRLPRASYAGAAPWRWAMAWFPIIGGLIGAVVAALWHWRGPLHEWPAAVLVVTSSILLTGALHEDGLADSADALGGAQSRDRVLEILKDSRIGAYGALALICSVMLRIASLAAMPSGAEIALILSHAFGRAAAVGVATALPYVTPLTSARSAAVLTGGRIAAAAALTSVLVILAAVTALSALTVSQSIVLLAVAVILTALCGAYFKARLGGMTGDLLGAAEQVCECGIMVTSAILFGASM